MNQNPISPIKKRSIWIRGLFMVLMAFAYHLAGTLVVIVAILQFVITLVSEAPNERLRSFGHNLGLYLQHIVYFLTFSSEKVPFPFDDWPAGD